MKKTPRLQISSTLRGERFRKKLRRYFACEIATSELHMVRRPSDCSNVHHGHQEKPCGRGGHALRARGQRGKEKTTVVILGSTAITSSKHFAVPFTRVPQLCPHGYAREEGTNE